MYQSILVTLDTTPTDRAIIDHIKKLARVLGSKVALLHVVTGVQAKWHGEHAAGEEVNQDQAYLDRVKAEFLADGIETEAHLAYGDPVKEIVKWVGQSGCDLVAMSTHGHQLVADLVLGATAHKVQHQVSVPVLLLRKIAPSPKKPTALPWFRHPLLPRPRRYRSPHASLHVRFCQRLPIRADGIHIGLLKDDMKSHPLKDRHIAGLRNRVQSQCPATLPPRHPHQLLNERPCHTPTSEFRQNARPDYAQRPIKDPKPHATNDLSIHLGNQTLQRRPHRRQVGPRRKIRPVHRAHSRKCLITHAPDRPLILRPRHPYQRRHRVPLTPFHSPAGAAPDSLWN